MRAPKVFWHIVVAGIAAAAVASALAQERTVVDLRPTQPGTLPDGFMVARTGKGTPAAWAVVEDPTAVDRRALAQTSTDRTDYRFPLAIYQPVTAANVDVTVRFKALDGRVDRAGGIAVRLTDPDNYYVLRANALEDNVNLYRVVKGVRSEIRGARAKVTSNEWHQLDLHVEGSRFTVSYDGKQMFTADDRSLGAPGRVALWTKADSVTRFDSLAIRSLP